MTRLEFAAAALLLAVPAAAKPAKTRKAAAVPAVVSTPLSVAESTTAYRDAAQRLFADPVQQEAFFQRASADPVLAGSVVLALKEAKTAKGGDAAVTAKLKANPAAGDWKTDTIDALTQARKTIAAGRSQKPPKTDYPETPFIGRLTAGLGKKDAGELFAALDVPVYGGALPTKPCPGAGTALAQLNASAAEGKVVDGAPCTQAGATAVDPKVTARPATGAAGDLVNGQPRTLTDQKIAVPTPNGSLGAGSDKGAPGGADKKGFFSGFNGETVARMGFLGVFGAILGTLGGPAGIAIGALVGIGLGFMMKGSGGDGSGG